MATNIDQIEQHQPQQQSSTFNDTSTPSIKTNVNDEEAQLLISAFTALQRNCLIEKQQQVENGGSVKRKINDQNGYQAEHKRIKIENFNNRNGYTNRKKLKNLIENFMRNKKNGIYEPKLLNKSSQMPLIELEKNEILSKVSYLRFYIDEEEILDVKEYENDSGRNGNSKGIDNDINETKCNLCFNYNDSKDKQLLIKHLNKHDLDKKRCICCNKVFNYLLEYNLHKCESIDDDMPIIRTKSSTIYYLCKLCCADTAKNELDTATGEQFDVNANDAYYSTYELYNEHIKSKHQMKIKCMLCDDNDKQHLFEYNYVCAYIHHLKIDHDIKSLTCSCQECQQ